MRSAPGHPRSLLVITGSIASGKSTLARAVAAALDRDHVRTAVIDLDLIHATLGTEVRDADGWQLARRGAAALADAFLAADVHVVVVEGEFRTPLEREPLMRVHSSAAVLFVTLRTAYEEALRRAQADPTRMRSRDPVFLRAHYDAVAGPLDAAPAGDCLIHTDVTSLEASVQVVLGWLRRTATVRDAPADDV